MYWPQNEERQALLVGPALDGSERITRRDPQD